MCQGGQKSFSSFINNLSDENFLMNRYLLDTLPSSVRHILRNQYFNSVLKQEKKQLDIIHEKKMDKLTYVCSLVNKIVFKKIEKKKQREKEKDHLLSILSFLWNRIKKRKIAHNHV